MGKATHLHFLRLDGVKEFERTYGSLPEPSGTAKLLSTVGSSRASGGVGKEWLLEMEESIRSRQAAAGGLPPAGLQAPLWQSSATAPLGEPAADDACRWGGGGDAGEARDSGGGGGGGGWGSDCGGAGGGHPQTEPAARQPEEAWRMPWERGDRAAGAAMAAAVRGGRAPGGVFARGGLAMAPK